MLFNEYYDKYLKNGINNTIFVGYNEDKSMEGLLKIEQSKTTAIAKFNKYSSCDLYETEGKYFGCSFKYKYAIEEDFDLLERCFFRFLIGMYEEGVLKSCPKEVNLSIDGNESQNNPNDYVRIGVEFFDE